MPRTPRIIQIDIDPSELGKNVDVDLSIAGDAAYVLNAMLPQIEEKKHPDWMAMIREWQAQDYHPVSDPTRLMPHQVIGEVCNQCGPEAVYVTDVGQHQMWAAQYLRHAKSRGFITSGGLGTMGFGYGAAIGAQMALGRDQRVVMFTGDGSFHMNLNEACTAVSYELPIITVIFNNQVLGMVRQWQTTFYGKRFSQTDPHRKTDFVKLAEGFGLKGYRCTNLPGVPGRVCRRPQAERPHLDRVHDRQGRESPAHDPRRRRYQRYHHEIRRVRKWKPESAGSSACWWTTRAVFWPGCPACFAAAASTLTA